MGLTIKGEYHAGKNCKCNAYGRHECCCGVDWTDARIYILRDLALKALNEYAKANDINAVPYTHWSRLLMDQIAILEKEKIARDEYLAFFK